jgi:hypothetical protein
LGEVVAKKATPLAPSRCSGARSRVQQQRLDADNPDIGLTMWNLAEVLRMLGRCDELRPLVRRTLEIWEGSFGPEHEWTAWGLICLSEVRLAQGDAAEAVAGAERAAKILERLFGAAHSVLGSTLNLHGRALLAAGRHAESEPVLARALEIQSSLGAEGHAAVAATRALLGECRARLATAPRRPATIGIPAPLFAVSHLGVCVHRSCDGGRYVLLRAPKRLATGS